ncbi:hypothetical protein [Methylobacterium sp. WL6]|uniref:hypothetical protein n=1 Tax=Methylobacterium sp. WL6 TaxID=2603901 RepID=UPI0011CB8C19|nr:hypothetical protein [Methylobacterium sp. WL6]TXN67266.1 hypothetical protein FV230_14485 [Methylobacterium sp. WL6]
MDEVLFLVGDAGPVEPVTLPLCTSPTAAGLLVAAIVVLVTLTFQAVSADASGAQPTLLVDPVRGALAIRLLRPAMSRQPPGDYPYTLVATDPVFDPDDDAPVIVFYGTIRHRAVLDPSAP